MAISDDLKALQDATNEYVTKEKTRIENEVAVLQAILDGRSAGSGIQSQTTKHVAAVAKAEIYAYLQAKQ
jgi:hypothetical protein